MEWMKKEIKEYLEAHWLLRLETAILVVSPIGASLTFSKDEEFRDSVNNDSIFNYLAVRIYAKNYLAKILRHPN